MKMLVAAGAALSMLCLPLAARADEPKPTQAVAPVSVADAGTATAKKKKTMACTFEVMTGSNLRKRVCRAPSNSDAGERQMRDMQSMSSSGHGF